MNSSLNPPFEMGVANFDMKKTADNIHINGIPENWGVFINAIKEFLSGFEHRELFNPEWY